MQLIIADLESNILCGNLSALSFPLLQQTLHKTSTPHASAQTAILTLSAWHLEQLLLLSCSNCNAPHAPVASPTQQWQRPGRRLQPHKPPPRKQPPPLGAQALLRPRMLKLAAALQPSLQPVCCPIALRTRSSHSSTVQLTALPACS